MWYRCFSNDRLLITIIILNIDSEVITLDTESTYSVSEGEGVVSLQLTFGLPSGGLVADLTVDLTIDILDVTTEG